MHEIQVNVQLSDRHYRCMAQEARRQGVTVESLVQSFAQQLVTEEEQRQVEDDHPIYTS